MRETENAGAASPEEMTAKARFSRWWHSGVPENEQVSLRNMIMYPLGTLGRDFLWNLFNGYLMSYILFTKTLTDAQFTSITLIIVAARIFDAFNDPIMGGIVENTRTKWGKFKPWQLIGAVFTGIVVISVFSTRLQGWAFIGFLAFIYLIFSIAFTMNDISYWGMLPSLSRNEFERSRLTSFAQLAAGAGGGLAGFLLPVLTQGEYALGGSAVTGFMWAAVFAAVIMIGFQLFTILGVKEKPLPAQRVTTEKITLKQMFKVIVKNDQLLWSALVMLIFNVGTGVVGGGLSMMYIYFEFGYKGLLLTLFGLLLGVASTLFTLLYPWLGKRFGRQKLISLSAYSNILGYALILLFGLALPSDPWMLKMGLIMVANIFVGFGAGFYMMMVITIANTVEYNEWKTGKRDEGLIFSIRPFTAKLGSALMQLVVMLVYLAVGVLDYTNAIADLENAAAKPLSQGGISSEAKIEAINKIIESVTTGEKQALLCCMCLIPIVFMIVAIIIYKKKCFLNEEFHARIVREIAERAASEEAAENGEIDGDRSPSVGACEFEGESAPTDSGDPNDEYSADIALEDGSRKEPDENGEGE